MSIQNKPHYVLPASALAQWLDQQGADLWWNVDGDSYLTALITFPCPGDELAAELRRINSTLLVLDKSQSQEAKGQVIDETRLDELVGRLGDDVPVTVGKGKPSWAENRVLYLSWKDRHEEWLLVEDRETTESSREEAAAKGGSR